jgi:putative ABC transport system permease protein
MAPGDGVWFRNGPQRYSVAATVLPSTGGPEDNQVFFYLDAVQKLLAQPHHISLIQLSVPGTSEEIVRFVEELQPQLGDAEGRPIRQFTEAQAKIYNSISGLLNYTVGIVLVLTGLCVMAAMTNVAMERKNDVGLMKAIGGSVRRVLRLFLAEAALLGLAGGMIGGATGIFLSIGLGKAVFGVAARPRLIVYPVAVALTIIVAILSAYPLRRLASIRPASVFRGEA